MRILVSNRIEAEKNFPNYTVVCTPEEVTNVRGVLNLLVIDGTSWDSPRMGKNTNKPNVYPELVKKSTLVVYISGKDNVDNHLKLIVNGAKGIHISNPALVKSQELLEGYLITQGINPENPKPVETSTDLVSTNTVQTILDSFSSLGDQSLSPQSRDLLVRTVKDFSQQVEVYVKAQQVAATSALEYADTNARIFSNLTQVNDKLKQQIAEFEDTINQTPSIIGGGSIGGARLSVFPKFALEPSRVKSHIKIKKIGNGVFCLSFVLGLKAYLDRKRNIRSQVIVLVPEQEYYKSLYQDYPWITSTSHKDGSAYVSGVVFVSYPTKQVLGKLVDNQGYYESLIFLDMMTQNTEHLVQSRKKTWYFSSSPTSIKKLHISVSDTIFSLKEQEGAAFSFKSWAKYPTKIGDRERAYIEYAGQMYSTMYESSL